MDPQLMRAFSQALRVEVLERIAANPASPKQIAEATGEPFSKITYHVSVLRQTGCIRPAEPTNSDPGDCVYEIATLMPSPPRLPLSDSTRGHAFASVLRRIVERGLAALEMGTLGKRRDNRARCESMVVDPRGWQEAQTILDEAAERLAAARVAASKRLAKSGEPGIQATIAFAAFESPWDSKPARG